MGHAKRTLITDNGDVSISVIGVTKYKCFTRVELDMKLTLMHSNVINVLHYQVMQFKILDPKTINIG